MLALFALIALLAFAVEFAVAFVSLLAYVWLMRDGAFPVPPLAPAIGARRHRPPFPNLRDKHRAHNRHNASGSACKARGAGLWLRTRGP